jgi:uncharacterized membrane-anchored protein
MNATAICFSHGVSFNHWLVFGAVFVHLLLAVASSTIHANPNSTVTYIHNSIILKVNLGLDTYLSMIDCISHAAQPGLYIDTHQLKKCNRICEMR